MYCELTRFVQGFDVFTKEDSVAIMKSLSEKTILIGIKHLVLLVRRASVVEDDQKVRFFAESLEPFLAKNVELLSSKKIDMFG